MVPVMQQSHGPGAPFQVLFDEDQTEGRSLPATLQALYGNDWRLPVPSPDRPYTYVNFVTSRDGRISFNEPGHLGGGAISRFSRHDQWLMGLLRSRADAILVEDTTLRLEPEHVWTAAAIFPDDAPAWQELRLAEGRAVVPLHICLSLTGNLPRDAAVFADPQLPILVATTARGVRAVQDHLREFEHVEARAFGHEAADLPQLLRYLRTERGIDALLCEGGAHVYGAMLAARQVDDEFLTLSPILVGNWPSDTGSARPSLVEGVAFSPERPPTSRLLRVPIKTMEPPLRPEL
jgi:riboflavin biosynthesis pyrimidine reductase